MVCGKLLDCNQSYKLTIEEEHWMHKNCRHNITFSLCEEHKKLFESYIDFAGDAFYKEYCEAAQKATDKILFQNTIDGIMDNTRI
jgi:hypothetical protein